MVKVRNGAVWAMALMTCVVGGCDSQSDDASKGPEDQAVGEASEALRLCPSQRNLVCGKDGRTYRNACRAGGWSRVAHIGACEGFLCNGVVCVSGFTCRTFTIYGVSTDQCVSDTGTAPACSCAEGLRCVQDPSGATHCEAEAPPPPPPPPPSTLCDGKSCPSGMHCAVISIYGVPTPSCMFD